MFETRRLSSKIILQVILTIMVLPFLFPLIAMVQESLSGQGWGNYKAVWATGAYREFFRNSADHRPRGDHHRLLRHDAGRVRLLKAAGALEGNVLLDAVGGLTLPEVVLLTPLFLIGIQLGLFNTYFSVILPLAALQIPFAVLLTRNFMNSIPDALFDAARVDGANAAVIFRRMIRRSPGRSPPP